MRAYPESAFEKLGFDRILQALADRAATSTGRQAALAVEPKGDRTSAAETMSRVSELMEILRRQEPLPWGQVPDVSDIVQRARPGKAILEGEAFLALQALAERSARVAGFFKSRKAEAPGLHETLQELDPLSELRRRIEGVVGEDGRVRASASPELRRIRRAKDRREEALRATMAREYAAAVEEGIAAEGQVTIRGGRMVMPIRVEAKRRVHGFVHDVSATGQTVFVEPTSCLEVNNELTELSAAAHREELRLRRELTDHVRASLVSIERNADLLTAFDVTYAMARLAQEMDAEVVEIPETFAFDLRRARNPALLLHYEAATSRSDDGEPREVVPLDLKLGGDVTTIVITGPNAGGKTVALKTVGLLAAMVAHGMPVPADEGSTVPYVEGLFVDLGDEQSIEDDLSTFSSHVVRLKEILDGADARSLVLIDEAGTGTDPDEGSALAEVALRRLTSRGVATVVTTHHGSLKAFADEEAGVMNASMLFDEKDMVPTYQFRPGLPGASYAFPIARRMGIPDDVLADARERVGNLRSASEELIAKLSRQHLDLADRLEAAERMAADAEEAESRYRMALTELKSESKDVRARALVEAERIVSEANARIERTIREIKEAAAEKKLTLEARRRFEGYRKRVEREVEEVQTRTPPAEDRSLAVGDSVVLDDGDVVGEIIEIEDEDVVVAFASGRLRIHRDRLRKASPMNRMRFEPAVRSHSVAMQASPSLNIRGRRVEEALPMVERFVDEGIAAGLFTLDILHGKGTGALRVAVREYLATRPEVGHVEDAPWDQGGAGITRVQLKK